MKLYHIIIYSPLEATNKIRSEIAKAGGGSIGNYDSCSFSSKGTGRFRPLEGSDPHIGTVNELEEVEEEKIEIQADESTLKNVIKAIKESHPYEEPAIHVIPMLDYKNL